MPPRKRIPRKRGRTGEEGPHDPRERKNWLAWLRRRGRTPPNRPIKGQ